MGENLDALMHLSRRLDTLETEAEIYQAAVAQARDIFNADLAAYMGLEEDHGTLSLIASDPDQPPQGTLPSQAAATGLRLSCDVARCPAMQGKAEFPCRQAAERFGTHWAIAGRVIQQGKTIGSLCVWSFRERHWGRADVHFLSLMADEVSRHVSHRRLATTQAEAEALRAGARLKDMFLSLCSHELRSPLASITSASELLLSPTVTSEEERREYARIIREQSNRLGAIVDDMLDAVRLQTGRMPIEPEIVALGPVVERVAGELVEPSPKHVLSVDIPADAQVWADPRRLEQVLRNLVGNAVKYSPGGGLVAAKARVEQHGQRVVVGITDQGVGIPGDSLDRLFTPFERIRRSEIAEITGTGLGLYVVREVLALMRGEIWVESERGKGSSFSFSLPLAPAGT